MRLIGLVCLALLLACSACGGSSAGVCLTATADPCNAGNQAVGALSHVPFGGGLDDR